MNVLIIGASRGIGRETAKLALKQGHQVTAFARHPEEIRLEHSKLHLAMGDVLEASSLDKAMKGQDAVICTLGLPTLTAIGPPFAKPSFVLSTGTANIITCMKKIGVKRLVCVTAIGTGDSAQQCTKTARIVLRQGLKWLFQEKDKQEQLIRDSGLDWTIIRPSALTYGRQKGAYLSQEMRAGLLTHVSRADVAVSLLKVIKSPKALSKALVVSYPARRWDSARWLAGYFRLG